MSADTATMTIGAQLVDFCKNGQYIEAIDALYADDIVSVEAFESPGHPKEMRGKEAIRGKSEWFMNANEIHGGEVKGPYPCEDGRFAVWMTIDMTPKEGPMAGNRFQMEEVCMYTVANGKIAKEEFFYNNS